MFYVKNLLLTGGAGREQILQTGDFTVLTPPHFEPKRKPRARKRIRLETGEVWISERAGGLLMDVSCLDSRGC
jgi:hypothetical protein